MSHDFVPTDNLTNLVAIALLFLLDRLSQSLRIVPPMNINRTAFCFDPSILFHPSVTSVTQSVAELPSAIQKNPPPEGRGFHLIT
ncbi:hypothetical protein [Microcoleus sp. S28C3]|uniref:hypothetical protein n=1 Tax=Microcoleus sp. S28C3 TaxID=3055414 RepID=UPI002FD39C03